MSSGSKIIKCTCENEFQDSEYGHKRRLANHADGKGNHKSRYRCTSCGSLTTLKSAEPTKEKTKEKATA